MKGTCHGRSPCVSLGRPGPDGRQELEAAGRMVNRYRRWRMRLPLRLEAVLRQVPPGEVVADIGTDHGLLPRAMVERRIASRAIATEVFEGALVAAKRLLAGTAGVELRAGWGLTPLRPGEAGVVVLAGMGGETIKAILAAGEGVARSARRLVLQPQNRPGRLRRWLLTNRYELVAEDLIEERGHFYPVIGAAPAPEMGTHSLAATVENVRRGLPGLPEEFVLEVGPLLLSERHPVLAVQLARRLAADRKLEARLAAQDSARAARRLSAVRAEIAHLEMVAEWLSQSVQS